MSTRACIARKTTAGFKGVYHHWDGYPSGLGKTLFKLYRGYFKKDLGAMLKYLIDDHPAGWSTINDADFTKPPGFEENGFKTEGPHCYCHGGRSEKGQVITQKNASNCGCEYVYVFATVDGKDVMYVLSSVYKRNGEKMIGVFGSGAASKDVYWKVLDTVDLNGRAPNWEKMA